MGRARARKRFPPLFAGTVVVFAFFVSTVLAAEAPKLPASAKRLNGAAIVALYDGKTFAYTSFTFFGVVTGEVTYDFKTETNHGTYQLGSRHGTFNGSIHVSGDKFCYKTGRTGERCNYVYIDGDDVYEVGQSGIVQSVTRAVRPSQPA